MSERVRERGLGRERGRGGGADIEREAGEEDIWTKE